MDATALQHWPFLDWLFHWYLGDGDSYDTLDVLHPPSIERPTMKTAGHEYVKMMKVGKLGGGDQIEAAKYMEELERECSRLYQAFTICYVQMLTSTLQLTGMKREEAQGTALDYARRDNPIQKLNDGTLGPAYQALKRTKHDRIDPSRATTEGNGTAPLRL